MARSGASSGQRLKLPQDHLVIWSPVHFVKENASSILCEVQLQNREDAWISQLHLEMHMLTPSVWITHCSAPALALCSPSTKYFLMLDIVPLGSLCQH